MLPLTRSVLSAPLRTDCGLDCSGLWHAGGALHFATDQQRLARTLDQSGNQLLRHERKLTFQHISQCSKTWARLRC